MRPPWSISPPHNHWFVGLRWARSEVDLDAHRRSRWCRWRRRLQFESSSLRPLRERGGQLADAGSVVVIAERGGDLDQHGVVEVATVGAVLPLVECVAEAPGVSGDAFEVVELVEHPPGRVHAVVIVDHVAELVDPASCRRCEFLGPAESIGGDSEDVAGCVDVAASRSAVDPTGAPQFTFGME